VNKSLNSICLKKVLTKPLHSWISYDLFIDFLKRWSGR